MAGKNLILSKEVAEKKLERIALEIAGELYGETEPLIIIGITGSGMVVAEKLFLLLKGCYRFLFKLITCHINKKQPEEISILKVLTLQIKIYYLLMM